MISTPLRDHRGSDLNGVIALAGSVESTLDSAARSLRTLIESAPGLPSWSTELVGRATGEQAPLVDPALANAVRSLAVPSDARVLELGAGVGTLTAYLGETAQIVDAIEPDLERARLVRLRTSGVDAVCVFSGELEDVPEEPAYDIIVATDALAHRGDASQFIASAMKRLAPGGTLVLAERNKLGVKYLAGSPDDTTGVPFDSIEDYPRGASVRPLSRLQLDQAIEAAGATAVVLPVMPDLISPRVILDPRRLVGDAYGLLAHLPLMPSPDRGGSRPKLADEGRMWAELAKAGLADQCANAFLALVTAAQPSALWPSDSLAVYHSWQRDAAYTAMTRVVDRDGTVFFDRTYPHARTDSSPGVVDSSVPFVPGETLSAAMLEMPESEVRAMLQAWKDLLSSTPDGTVWLDSHPGNVVLNAAGALTPIDLEFQATAGDLDFSIRRCILILARAHALAAHPSRWPKKVATLRDIAHYYGEMVGYGAKSGWVAQTVAEEAQLQTVIAGSRAPQVDGETRTADLERMLDTRLRDVPLGTRAFDDLVAFDARIRGLEDHESILLDMVAQQHERILETDRRLGEAQDSRDALRRHVHSLESRLAEARAAAPNSLGQ